MKTTPGPVMLDIVGATLSADDVRRLAHPMTGGVILFARHYENRTQLVALTDAEVQQLVGGIGLGVTVFLVPLGDTEAFGNTQGQEPVALVRGGDILVVPALVEEAQGRDATASRGERVVVVLGSHRVVVEQAQAEQPAGGAAELEGIAVVA